MKRPAPQTAIIVGALVVGGALSATAQEQKNSWCAYFSGGPTDCGYATFEECLNANHGKTGLCDRKGQYVRPARSRSAAFWCVISAAYTSRQAFRDAYLRHRRRQRQQHGERIKYLGP